jgi:hypothetical protein
VRAGGGVQKEVLQRRAETLACHFQPQDFSKLAEFRRTLDVQIGMRMDFAI